ncbi:MAG TPA: mannitol dehydrogenase family protein [Lachnospiraceae bacterium]|nr:mannitol dehydrogenase family protein [Lachnospiraceae bacterium]
MKLTDEGIKQVKEWKKKEFSLPEFNREEVIKRTCANPTWIHFGAGNILRAYQANVVQDLLNKKVLKEGIIVAEGYDYEIIDSMYRPHDNLSILVTLRSNGAIEKTVVGSIVETLKADCEDKDFGRLKEIFGKESLQMVSFTITEKGYSLIDGTGVLMKSVANDIQNGPKMPESYMGKIVSLLYERYQAGAYPIAMVSMDNCARNGEKLFNGIVEITKGWEKNGLVQEGFLTYIENEKLVGFPWTMIDKITPRPDDKIKVLLEGDGIEHMNSMITEKNSYVAPFVNAEECQYLVIEDCFPNGHPKLEAGGVIFTTRKKVEEVERMKVCTCLNPLHTTLAIFGCLLGFTSISEETNHLILRKMVERIGYQEGLPVVTDPGIINPETFLDEVIQKRLSNPFLGDTPQRIASDTSQKLGIRFGETIAAYRKSNKLNTNSLKMIPLVFAGWLRYLMAVDDQGNDFKLSPDPLLTYVCPYIEDIKLGGCNDVHKAVKPILERKDIFGVNLYEDNLGERVEAYFEEMITGKGAVMKTLEKHVK